MVLILCSVLREYPYFSNRLKFDQMILKTGERFLSFDTESYKEFSV